MFNYSEKQTKHELDEKMIGGQPGEHPTLLIGSVFYEGEFADPESSLDEASDLIHRQRELEEKTNLNSMVDVFIYDQEEIEWKLDFMLDETNGMFSIDVPESEVRIAALEYLDEQDELNRILFNSINLGITEREKKVLKRASPKAGIILGYNPKDTSVQGRMDIIKNGDSLIDTGLIEICEENDIIPFLDPAATPFGKDACETFRSIPVFKSEFGLPTGCSPHNVVESWQWLDERDNSYFETVDSSLDIAPIVLGADFLYYGPIENSEKEFHNIAAIDKLIAEGSETYFGTKIERPHPYYLE